VQALVPSRQSWARPNRRALANGIMLPGNVKETINGCIHYDTSGSITDKILQEFNSQVKAIMSLFPSIKIHILVGDSKLCYEKDIDQTTNLDEEITLKGGGGTSHDFFYKYIQENTPMFAMSFTDGYSDIDRCVQLYEISCPVLFVMPTMYSNKDIEQYGEVIEIELDP
jgi:predicted metal-dependent peptidase